MPAARPPPPTGTTTVGGGGLAAGIVAALAEARPRVRVVGVQAARAAAYPASLAAGRPVAAPELRTMADGIAVGVPGSVPFGILSEHRIPVRTVSEEDLSRALLLVAERAKMLVEPSGAAAAAAVMAGVGPLEGPVVVILSGGREPVPDHPHEHQRVDVAAGQDRDDRSLQATG